MEKSHMLRVLLAIFTFQNAESVDIEKFELLMPNVQPYRDELYLCTPVKVVPEKSYYIVGFEPNATMDKVHHMILYGCTTPGTMEKYWDCGEMAVTNINEPDGLQKANPCGKGSHVLYAWARDAKTLELPEDVGFQVGYGTDIAYLVLQIHYAKKLPNYELDESGVNIMFTLEPRSKLAGVILLGTGGDIPPHNITHMEASCVITENKIIHPFAYRTHTHSLGKVVSGYKVQRDSSGYDKWTLLGKRDPMTPQMFYPTFTQEPIYRGDVLASRCTMESNRDTFTHVGPTNKDEMCNFYLMYYVDHGTPLEMKYCMTSGPPYFYWNHPPISLNNIPEKQASSLHDQY